MDLQYSKLPPGLGNVGINSTFNIVSKSFKMFALRTYF